MIAWMVVFSTLVAALFSGCSGRKTADRTLAPAESGALRVKQAAWVSDRAEVARACGISLRHPLIERLRQGMEPSRLAFVVDGAMVVHGTLEDSRRVTVTLLPHVVGGDPTHAAYFALTEQGTQSAACSWDLIVGRDPRPDEVDYVPMSVAGRLLWVREGADFAIVGAGPLLRSSERWNRRKFMACMAEELPRVHDAGAALGGGTGADFLRPLVETIGAAVTLVSCGLKALA